MQTVDFALACDGKFASKARAIAEALAVDIDDGGIGLASRKLSVAVGEIIRELRIVSIDSQAAGIAHLHIHARVNGDGFACDIDVGAVDGGVASETHLAIGAFSVELQSRIRIKVATIDDEFSILSNGAGADDVAIDGAIGHQEMGQMGFQLDIASFKIRIRDGQIAAERLEVNIQRVHVGKRDDLAGIGDVDAAAGADVHVVLCLYPRAPAQVHVPLGVEMNSGG